MTITGTTSPPIRSISLVPDIGEQELPLFSWPELDPKALYGLAGEVVRAGEYTNVEPAGLLIAFLTATGAVLSNTSLRVGNYDYPTRLFSVLAGSDDACISAIAHAKKFFAIQGESKGQKVKKANLKINSWPLEMGEDFINAVTEPGQDEDTMSPLRAVPGSSNRHVLLTTPTFGRTLRASKHVRNSLATMLTLAYDDDHLKLVTRSRKQIDGGRVNVGLLAYVPIDELQGSMPKQSDLRTLASRTLWTAVRQDLIASPQLDGSICDHSLINSLSALVSNVLANGKRKLTLNNKSSVFWRDLQAKLKLQQCPGMAATFFEKAHVQVLRLATIYAVLDESSSVLPEHLEAAMAVWAYCRTSAQMIFGENKIGEVAQKIILALAKGEKTQTDLRRDVFGDNVPASLVVNALTELQAQGVVVSIRGDGSTGKGRPATAWRLVPERCQNTLFAGSAI